MRITRLVEEKRIINTVRIIDGSIKKEAYKYRGVNVCSDNGSFLTKNLEEEPVEISDEITELSECIEQEIPKNVSIEIESTCISRNLEFGSESIILPAQRYDRFLINCRDYHYTCGFTDSKLSYEHVKRAIITATNMSKKARPIVINSGIYDVILYPQVSGALIHEVIGHLCESDIFLESKRDYFLLGDDLNNPLITVYDDPSVKSGWGSIKMDDEGNIPKKVCMIKNGIVTGFLTNEKTADILSVPNNARARCQDYEHLPLVRMTNTIMEKGSDDVTEIIHNLDKGIICITSIGAVLHGDTWELIVSEGILVEGQNRRRITNFRIKGTVLDVIKKITKVSKQRETVSGFYCRKKHQDIPVSVTTPFLMVNDVSVEQC